MNTTGSGLYDALLSVFDKGIATYNGIADRKVAVAQANAVSDAAAAAMAKPVQVTVTPAQGSFQTFLKSTQGQIVIAVVVLAVVALMVKLLIKR